jgi:UPF0042 nucleotide-binding protein
VARSIVILTGQSGSGKSAAIRALEDNGYFCVDNIPTGLAEKLIESMTAEEATHNLALVMDVRSPAFAARAPALVRRLRDGAEPARVVYLEAREDVLIRRYSETRRRHPLDDGDGLRKAIADEREILAPLRELADDTIDTSEMSPHDLRDRVLAQILKVSPGDDLRLAIISFGFKHGLPLEADTVFDVRFLPNPYFEASLRDLTGLDARVREYVFQSGEAEELLRRARGFLDFLIPRYQREGKRYLTVAIGCTGGQHRSVAIASALAERLQEAGTAVDVRHRDIPGGAP